MKPPAPVPRRPSVAVLGTRGIPASYSGFETSVEETASRLALRGFPTRVYCRAHHYRERPGRYRDVELVHLGSVNTKHLDTVTHTLASVFHLLVRRTDVAILYGVGNAAFIPLLRLARIPVIAVLDGADWKRQKWGALARRLLACSRWVAVSCASTFVVDNERLAGEYRALFRKEPVYVPYGVAARPAGDGTVLERFGLREREYVIFVGRFVEEKGVERLIRVFERTQTDKKLVLVGGNPHDRAYEEQLRGTSDGRIVFTGMLYGEPYETLLSRALFYVSCSHLEGTSPSLLAAMALNGFALVADIEENRETLKGTCATFSSHDDEDLRARLSHFLDRPEEVEAERERTRSVVRRHYDWDRVTGQYAEMIESLVPVPPG